MVLGSAVHPDWIAIKISCNSFGFQRVRGTAVHACQEGAGRALRVAADAGRQTGGACGAAVDEWPFLSSISSARGAGCVYSLEILCIPISRTGILILMCWVHPIRLGGSGLCIPTPANVYRVYTYWSCCEYTPHTVCTHCGALAVYTCWKFCVYP